MEKEVCTVTYIGGKRQVAVRSNGIECFLEDLRRTSGEDLEVLKFGDDRVKYYKQLRGPGMPEFAVTFNDTNEEKLVWFHSNGWKKIQTVLDIKFEVQKEELVVDRRHGEHKGGQEAVGRMKKSEEEEKM